MERWKPEKATQERPVNFILREKRGPAGAWAPAGLYGFMNTLTVQPIPMGYADGYPSNRAVSKMLPGNAGWPPLILIREDDLTPEADHGMTSFAPHFGA